MNDFDRYDFAFSMLCGGISMGILVLGGPLWAIVPVYATGATISLYRHLPLPPRRKRQEATIGTGENDRRHATLR